MKTKITIIILVLAMAISLIFLTGCPRPDQNPGNTTYHLDEYVLKKDGETLSQPECIARNISDKILVLHAEHCGACKIAVPILEDLEEELEAEFLYYDLDTDADRDALDEFKLVPYYTPTVIIGCKVYIGAKTETFYRSAIERALE